MSLIILATPAVSHELWLEPLAYTFPADGRITGNIVNGENFGGMDLVYLPARIARYEVIAGDASAPVEMRAGDRPGLDAPALAEGLNVVVYQSTPTELTYKEFEKFERFLKHKDLGLTGAEHLANGHPETEFVEVYTRYSKTLVGVGNAEGSDRDLGLETEFIALSNPYTEDTSGGFQAMLTYQGTARADAQVEIFDKAAPDAEAVITTLRTDANGVVTVPVEKGHTYMLDAVVLRDPAPDLAEKYGAIYETLWANLTFAVPE